MCWVKWWWGGVVSMLGEWNILLYAVLTQAFNIIALLAQWSIYTSGYDGVIGMIHPWRSLWQNGLYTCRGHLCGLYIGHMIKVGLGV